MSTQPALRSSPKAPTLPAPSIKIEIEVPARRIADMMVGAIEGNHMTRAWCAGVYLRGAWEKKLNELGNWYDQEKIFGGQFTVEIIEILDESKEAKGSNLKRHRCNQDDFAKGLALMAKNSPDHFGDMMAENDDNITQDVFLQYVALGEIVYG